MALRNENSNKRINEKGSYSARRNDQLHTGEREKVDGLVKALLAWDLRSAARALSASETSSSESFKEAI